MAAPVTPPRGMRDILPAEKARRERVLATIRDTYRRFGFDEIEAPALEEHARLHSGLGGDNEKLSFGVLRRGLTAEDVAAATERPSDLTDLGLRFDLTVPLARYYASNRAQLPPVLRALHIGPVWRAERPQKGRYRQFVQCDIDIIGESGALAEVELIQATVAALDALGLDGTRVRLNDRRVLDAVLAAVAVPEAQRAGALITLDKLDKIGRNGVVAELAERGVPGSEGVGALLDAVEAAGGTTEPTVEAMLAVLPAGVDEAVVAELAAVAAATGGERVAFDPFLVRGMGYYTGTIFEIEHPDVPYSLGGGGRYDGMIGRFLGQDVPACGSSLGFERIVDLLPADAGVDGDRLLLVHDRDADPAHVARIKAELVAGGTTVRLERRAKNMRAVLERGQAAGCTAVATLRADTASAAELERRPLGE